MTGSYAGLGTCFVNIHASGENSSEKSTEICYHWYSAIPISLVIVAILYPLIVIGKKHAPVLLGR